MKKIFACSLAVLFLLGMIAAAGTKNIANASEADLKIPELSTAEINAPEQDGIKLFIDGQQVIFSKEDGLGTPFIESGRTMVPLRKPFEAIGASVDYDAASRTATVTKDYTSISIIADGGMFINGSAYRVDAPAVIKDGRVYVPIRPVFEALGYSLSWNPGIKTVTIMKTGEPIETVQGWSVPGAAAGAAGLGMTDDIGVLTPFATYGQEVGETVSLKNQAQLDQLNSVSIGLRNFSEDKPVRLDSITLEYQVYKKTNEKEELVYQKFFLPFEGTLPALSGTSTEMEVSFWNSETAVPGEYVIKLAYPEFFTGINMISNEAIKIPIKRNIFGETAVINIVSK